jgi:hypothetical protein
MADSEALEDVLAQVIKAAVSPEAQEAQVLLLKRLALEGSVFPTRVPAPLNITEVGGYLNLLASAGESKMRTSAIASALGLASPSALSWDDAPPRLGFANVMNDPALVASKDLPISVAMRADFAAAWKSQVVPELSALGAVLPLWSRPINLPPLNSIVSVPDPLIALGRVVWIAPAAALVNPDIDPVVIGRSDLDVANLVRVMMRVDPTAVTLPAGWNWNAVVWDEVSNLPLIRAIGSRPLLDVEPIVGLAGFKPMAKPVIPTSRNELSWSRLTNTSGLLAGITTLGDELRLVWSERAIARSQFSAHLEKVWNGKVFA